MSFNMKVDHSKMDYSVTEPGEEVVISGISGKFPESKNILELKHNLMNKVDLITNNESRWKLDHAEIPKDSGKMADLDKFDAIFFGVNFKQAHTLDPMCRLAMECSYEAIVDAGVNPRKLRGTNTAVVMGACISESEKTWFYERLQSDGFGITGCSRAMLANRISYYLNVHGPSYSLDSACSSSLVALDHGYRLIRTGVCDNAIVGGCNLCLHPYVTLQFARLGVLAPDCRCKTFDERANGYVRSEAVTMVFLQKAKHANRIYAQVVYTKTNCDGYKEQGITFPATDIQRSLLSDFYRECKISPNVVSFLEAHGTGTAVGDPQELNAIEKVFCQNRKTPLMIGSIKSNLGHTEPASGLCSVAKILIAMEGGVIPPNMHFKNPVKGIKCFEEKTAQVVTEPTPWKGGYIGVNSFGFGGVNAHALLKSHTKEKVNNGAPSDDLPRLVAVSGRTQEALETLLGYVESIPVDVEYIRLIHNVYEDKIVGHPYRGYTLVGSKSAEQPPREIQEYQDIKRPVWFVFSGMGSQWVGMGEAMMRFPVFAKAVQKCAAVLKPRGIDIVDVITSKDKRTYDNIMNSFVGIGTIQIGLVDLLKSMGIEPDNIIGHSVGELGCAYADGCLTAEQMILLSYYRGVSSLEAKVIHGAMAAVGLGYEELKDLCPPDIDIACHNSAESSTISGPFVSVMDFVTQLQAKKIFAKAVASGNIAYHSRYIGDVGPKLLEYTKSLITEPKLRSSKWISTSAPRNKWNTEAAKYSSAEYHTNNLLNPVLFAEMSTMIPDDAITIEIAPHGLLQAILRRSLGENTTNISLMQRGHKDNVDFFSQALGKLYNIGLQPQLANLYPHVEFPVSRGTPMISPYIRWEHSNTWFVPNFNQRQKLAIAERTIEVSLADDAYEYISNHIIDGRMLIPATGYLVMVWETFSFLQGELVDAVSVVFEDIKFERATSVPTEGKLSLIISIHRGSGRFEISDKSTTVVTGRIRELTNTSKDKIPANCLKQMQDDEILTCKDIYKELNLRGYQYNGIFRVIKSASINATRGHLAWYKNWAAFMDGMLHMKVLSLDTRALYIPTAIQKVVIDVVAHNEKIRSLTGENNEIPVTLYKNYNTIVAGGIEIHQPKATSILRRKVQVDPVLEEYKFVANRDRAQVSLEQMIILSTQLALESHILTTPKFLELIKQEDKLPVDEILTPIIVKVLGNLPMIRPSLVLAANTKANEELPISENVTLIEPSELPEDGSIFMAVAYNILSNKRSDSLKQILHATADQGFVLLRENVVNKDTFSQLKAYGLNTVLEKTFNNQTLLLLKKEEQPPRKTEVVYVKNNEFNWVEKVKAVLKNEKEKTADQTVRLVLVGEGDMENGVLGMVKCLRREPYGDIVKAVIIQDKNAPKFSLNDPFYSKQLDLDIGFNVLRPKGVWGTYRHVPYSEPKPISVPHGYADMTIRGNLSSFQWMQGPLEPNKKDDYLVKVVYSSINFRDVMLATGKLSPEAVTQNRKIADCLIGFEYSGIDSNGRRVMGFVESRGLSNIVAPSKYLVWPVPDEWTLEEAATVPSAYFTVFYAFYQFGKLKKGEKVLIHAGSGAVGQAAIHVALSEGCEVFTTVGTDEKRKFIKKTFPSISDDHIGNSRDTSFEQMVMDLTNGQGVDIVLNSLAEDKLQASIRCLGYRGRFLEIGKFDMAANNEIGLEVFLKEISFHGIILDSLFNGTRDELQNELHHFLSSRVNSKLIKPLIRKCFEKNQLEEAFRYMAAGKHIGKILIKIADEKEPFDAPIIAHPRFNAVSNKTYVIVGGLGGLGLELTDWLVLRGARNVVIASRNGIKTGYQRWRTEIWKSYGVKVLVISGVDLSKPTDCEFVLKSAEKQAPVDGIFNLAALLKDCLMENQSAKSFEESVKPKAGITKQLDELSRKICPNLRHFVVFSSLSCGRGTAGQTNYGLGNAVMERICERRVEEGLPGMAIQWGAVGDVGLAVEMKEDDKEIVIGGTLPQAVASCLEEMDKFMVHSKPIVASMVVAEKRASTSEASNVLEAVMEIMNIKDLKTVGPTLSLAELGMDSMMVVEIKQTLERDFDVFLTPQDIRSLNISKLTEMSLKEVKIHTKKTAKPVKQTDVKETGQIGAQMLLNTLNLAILSDEQCVKLNVKHVERTTEVILIPGIEGSTEVFLPLTSLLKHPATCLQLIIDNTAKSVQDMVKNLLPHVLARIKGREFIIVGYSFGTMVALEIVRKLEELGMVGRLILIDGSPDYMKAINAIYVTGSTEEERRYNFLNDMLVAVKSPTLRECQLEMAKCTTWEEKVEKVSEHVPEEVRKIYSKEGLMAIIETVYKRLIMMAEYIPPSSRLRTPIMLLVPTLPAADLPDVDYGLSKYTHGRVTVHRIKGNHLSMMESKQIALAINGDPLDDEGTFEEELSFGASGEAIID